MKVVTVRMPPAVHRYLIDRAHEQKLSMNQFCLKKLMDLSELQHEDPLMRPEPTLAQQGLMAFLEEEDARLKAHAELEEKLKQEAEARAARFARPVSDGSQQTIPVKGWTNSRMLPPESQILKR